MTSRDDTAGPLWVGIDLGTQSAKVSIVDSIGTVVGAVSTPLVSVRHLNRHEQDPAHWISAAASALAQAIIQLPPTFVSRISAVAICATSGTITTVDTAGRPRSTGIMYDDARAGVLAGDANAVDPEQWKRLGYRIQPSWALPKMAWLAGEGVLGDGRFIAHQPDVLAAAIIGTRVSSDWSHALKSGYDLIALQWPPALEKLGIDASRLPAVVAPGSVLGLSSASWFEQTGLPRSVPVIAGMTDGCAAQLAAATLTLGDWHTVIGTTMVLKGVSDRIISDESGAVYSHRAPHEDLWFPGGASSVGAGAISALLPAMDLTSASGRLRAIPLETIPISYPLTGVGERFPFIEPDAVGFVESKSSFSLSAAVIALPADTLLASIMLGIACAERLSLETMARAGASVDGSLSSSGGGTRSTWWTQLRADLLGRTITIPESSEGSIGMAILAAWGSSPRDVSFTEVASGMTTIGRVFEPRPANYEILHDKYSAFLDNLSRREWITA